MRFSSRHILAFLSLALSLTLLAPIVLPAQNSGGTGKSSTQKEKSGQNTKKKGKKSESDEERREREEYERERLEHPAPRKPMPWGGGIIVEPIEGPADTVSFHIGAPVFLRLRLSGDLACKPFDGQPFYFDAAGAQLGWGFEEVNDSVLFPRTTGSCDRIIMLTSENSNRLAEGTYSMKVMIFVDDKTRLYSDTILVHPVHSASGANDLSYRRFLLEQLVRNTPLLHDPETIRALFADGTPRSAESEVYRAVILYRGGDIGQAEESLVSATQLAAERKAPLDRSASATAEALKHLIRGETSSH
jgi:hypothetical protein